MSINFATNWPKGTKHKALKIKIDIKKIYIVVKWNIPLATDWPIAHCSAIGFCKYAVTGVFLKRNSNIISIDKSGNYFINVGEESLAIDLEELKRKSKVIYDANPEIEVVFQSDKDVSFDFVAKAMASIQSVGISKIGIVTSGYEN